MSGISGKNTKPEIAVRQALHRLGFRYRLHVRDLPGKPDIVLPRYRAVVNVHGCFWHRHPGCRYATTPASNAEFWRVKLQGNVERDKRTDSQLASLGWRVFTVWECESGNAALLRQLAKAITNVKEPKRLLPSSGFARRERRHAEDAG